MKSNILKRVISLTLAVLIALSVIAGIAFSYFANAETYDDTMIKFDCYNPTKKEDLIDISVWDDINNQVIQGGRSANSLIVYDSKYPKSKTGTNEFGIEIIVDDKGVVTAVGKGDLTINKTGYIISGHGDKAKWLEKYATVGAVLAINTTKKFVCVLPQDEQAVKVIYDSINNIFNKIMDTYNQANDGIFDIDYTKAKELIESATGIYNECASLVSVDKAMQLIENKFNLIQLEEDIKKICTVSRIAEERGVWVRPSQTTQQDVENYVKGIAQSNLTTIYLETWFNGYTIFPTQNQITKQNPIFNGFDVLKAYVDACKKYDLKLHAWVENFFVGMESVDNGGIVIAAKPEWLMKSKAGTTYENTIYGKCYFINPAMKECRSFVLSIYEEIIKNYDIDGLQLDYVRYPEKVSDETDFGYDDTTMNGFKSETGIDPLSIQSGSSEETKWNNYRENIINTFVYEVYDKAKELKNNIVVSACVAPWYENSKIAFKQNPEAWITKDKIDVIIQMNYDFDNFETNVIQTANLISKNEKVSAIIGISSQSGYTSAQYIELMKKASILKISGTAHFEGSYYNTAGYDKTLLSTFYREKATTPIGNKDNAIKAQFDYVDKKFENLYKPLISEDAYNQIFAHWVKVKELYNNKEYDNSYIEMNLMIDKVDELKIPRQKIDTNLSTDMNIIKFLAREYFSDNIIMPEKQEAIEKDNKMFILILISICVIVVALAIVSFFIIKKKKKIIKPEDSENDTPNLNNEN